MVPTVKDIISLIEHYAPPDLMEEWDNSGLQVGAVDTRVRRVAAALDPTFETVNTAVKEHADLLITHHPLIFPHIQSIEINTGAGRVLAHAIKNSLSLYCAHTTFDHAVAGTNTALAETLDLVSIRPLIFSHDDASRGDGIVIWGELKNTMALDEFAFYVKGKLGAPSATWVGEHASKVTCVAVCGGSGGDYIHTAKEHGAQVFVTGEVSYHRVLLAKDIGIGLVLAGHLFTEKPVVSLLTRLISAESVEKKWDIDVFGIEPQNPFSFV
jgi:dinuclear metal center YbgI/SA1388 family protein